ncbi:citrate lyase acyl carrier protein [Streptococcus pluranimalium]|uniref:citrate lyase acyl carrier protein n=1 Tax=Streptococcus pluranimalium TaxID=82348 RepID=UPI001C4AB6A8|nr:citrate lyase acyl carrier protein [Streptococcus pluranimalium]WFM79194.1 citrate lyase acyl carrier protein [Streptococcus pluranimalium]
MEIKQTAVAGSLESSDIMLTLSPSEADGISISLDSSVEKQFGAQIRRVIEETLANLGVTSARVEAVDKGALDCTIQARTIAAAHRAAGLETYNWKEIDSWNV